jgi:hypothetical protein
LKSSRSKEVAEFAQRQAAGDRLDIARHVIGNNLFDETVQDASLNRGSVRFNQAVSQRC